MEPVDTGLADIVNALLPVVVGFVHTTSTIVRSRPLPTASGEVKVTVGELPPNPPMAVPFTVPLLIVLVEESPGNVMVNTLPVVIPQPDSDGTVVVSV